MSKRILWLISGTLIMGLGIECIVLANCGSDSISTLIVGLLQYSNIPFGRWSQLISCLMIISTFWGYREILGIGSIVNALLLGQSILFFDFLLGTIVFPIYEPLLSLMGFILMAFGTVLYLQSDLGAGPVECVMLLLSKKFQFSITKSRIILDFSITGIGILLGASYGTGTLFAIFLLGPLIELFNKLLVNHRLK